MAGQQGEDDINIKFKYGKSVRGKEGGGHRNVTLVANGSAGGEGAGNKERTT